MPGYEGKTINELEKSFHEDSIACEYVIPILGKIKSKKAVPTLRYIKNNNVEKIEYGSMHIGYVCSEGGASLNVTRALENILGSGERK
jgi:hypothetical protein